MKQITAKDFNQAVNSDPAWASHLTEPVEFKNYFFMVRSGITHLSPYLHFNGFDLLLQSACFAECKDLKVATGHFAGNVDFSGSGVEEISGLYITAPDKCGNAASFEGCKNLKVAEGRFPGYVDFSDSGIKRIGNLEIEPNKDGLKADFTGCHDLRLPDKFLGPEYVMEETTRQKNLERNAAAKAQKDQPNFEI